MAVFRAIETRRWLVRAASTGISGFIDPTGEIGPSLPVGGAGSVVAAVELKRGETAYVRWGESWIVISGLALAVVAPRRGQKGAA